jgi:hypothetical protein
VTTFKEQKVLKFIHLPESEGEFFLKELGTATYNIGFDDCLVLGWAFFNRAKQ